MKFSVSVILGLTAGAVFGFMWSQSTKKSIADNISTSMSNGVLTIKANVTGAAVQGLADIFN